MIDINDYLELEGTVDHPILGDDVQRYAVEADELYPLLIERILELMDHDPSTGPPVPHIPELVQDDDLAGSVTAMQNHYRAMMSNTRQAYDDALNMTCDELMDDRERLLARRDTLVTVRRFLTRMFKIRYPYCILHIKAGEPDRWRQLPNFE